MRFSPGRGPVQSVWGRDDSERNELLYRAEECARLTDPSILPPKGQGNGRLPETYQSVGSRGVETMAGAFLLSTLPLDLPFFEHRLAPEILYDPTVPPDLKGQANQSLFLNDLIIQSYMENNGRRDYKGHHIGLRSRVRTSLLQMIVTGDTLERCDENLKTTVYGRRDYVVRRKPSGDVVYYIVRDRIDPLDESELTREHAESAGIDLSKLRDASYDARLMDLFTRCAWHPDTKKWVIEQEINGYVINTSEELTSPFWSTPYKLAPKEHYGRGMVEMNLGELKSLDKLQQSLVEMMGGAAKQLAVIDELADVTADEIADANPFDVIRGRVADGVARDVAMMGFGANIKDYNQLTSGLERITGSLDQAFLNELALQPQEERVTATQVNRIAQYIDNKTGGLYTSIADLMQRPRLDWAKYQLRRQNKLAPIDEKYTETVNLTGLLSMQRSVEAQKLLTLPELLRNLPPEAADYLHVGHFIRALAMRMNINDQTILRSDEEVAVIREARAQEAAQQAIVEQGARAGANAATQAA